MTTAYIFGGAGFIGTRLAKSLVENGGYQHVVSLDIAAPKQALAGVDYVDCDVRLPISHTDLPASSPAHVYNLAAVHRTPGHPDADYFNTNVWGAINIARFAEDVGASRIVFTSSIAVYGPTEDPVDETVEPTPTSAYGKSKLMAEAIHRTSADRHDHCQLVVIRPAVIFGPGEGGNFTRLAKALSTGLFVYPGRRDTIKSCGYVDELIRAMTALPDKANDDLTFNFCYPERYTIEDICTAFHTVAGLGPPRGTLPGFAATCLGAAGDLLSAVGLPAPINSQRIAKLQQSTNIVPKALQQLNYRFETDLQSSLKRWMEEDPKGRFL